MFQALEGDDDVFNDNSSSYLLPNFGLGVYYYTRSFYAGVSVPLLLGYKTSESGKITAYHDFKKYAWYLTTGVNIKIADPWVLQPSAMLEYEIPSGLIADAGASVIYKDVLRVGCTYRSKQALVMIMDYKLNYQLHVGLAYDYGMNGINEYNRNSFEIILEYNFGFQVKASNPTLF